MKKLLNDLKLKLAWFISYFTNKPIPIGTSPSLPTDYIELTSQDTVAKRPFLSIVPNGDPVLTEEIPVSNLGDGVNERVVRIKFAGRVRSVGAKTDAAFLDVVSVLTESIHPGTLYPTPIPLTPKAHIFSLLSTMVRVDGTEHTVGIEGTNISLVMDDNVYKIIFEGK